MLSDSRIELIRTAVLQLSTRPRLRCQAVAHVRLNYPILRSTALRHPDFERPPERRERGLRLVQPRGMVQIEQTTTKSRISGRQPGIV